MSVIDRLEDLENNNLGKRIGKRKLTSEFQNSIGAFQRKADYANEKYETIYLGFRWNIDEHLS